MQEIINFINNLVPLFKSLILDNSVAIVVTAFWLFMLWHGYRRGLMARIISLGSVLLTLIVEIRVYPYVLDLLNKHTGWQTMFREIGRSVLADRVSPHYSPLYDLLGLNTLAENAGELAGGIALKALLFLLLFVAFRLVLKVAAALIGGLRRIGLIRWMDSWLGAVLGAAEGLIYIWLAMFLLSAVPNLQYTRPILDQIMRNRFLFILYNENLITQFVADLLH